MSEQKPLNPAVRYAALVAFAPLFFAGEMRSDPPFSNERTVLLAILVGTLLWGYLITAALGMGP